MPGARHGSGRLTMDHTPMTSMRRAVALVTLLLSCSASPASVQQVWSVLAKLNVGGTWASPCTEAPSDTNWYQTYFKDAAGTARRQANRGPEKPQLNSTIDSDHHLTPTTFLMRIRNDDANWGTFDGMAFDTIIEITPRGMHTLSSTRVE